MKYPLIQRLVILSVCNIALASCGGMPNRDLDYERLQSSLRQLESDPALASFAQAEKIRAQSALQGLKESSNTSAKNREHSVYLAERRIDMAWVAAQAEQTERQLMDLQREHDQMVLEATRKNAELARLELEKQRIQSLAQAEESARLLQEADIARTQNEQAAEEAEAARQETAQAKRLAAAQAKETALAKQEAELTAAIARSSSAQNKATATPNSNTHVTLGDGVFAPGQSILKTDVKTSLMPLIKQANKNPKHSIRIEGHTDDSGDSASNQVLSQKRAETIRDVLIAAGIAARQITVTGVGESSPIASNDTAESRAQNRRVEVFLNKK